MINFLHQMTQLDTSQGTRGLNCSTPCLYTCQIEATEAFLFTVYINLKLSIFFGLPLSTYALSCDNVIVGGVICYIVVPLRY